MTRGTNLRLADYLGHILEAIERIRRYADGMLREDFGANEKTQDAVIRNLEVIGEAAHNIESRHPEFTAAHPELPWVQAYEMRNALAHGYFQIDLDIVWQTMVADLPDLERQVRLLRECILND